MNDQPVYLRGKGRGRGSQGDASNSVKPSGRGRGNQAPPISKPTNNGDSSAEKRFAEAKSRLESSVQRHLANDNGTNDSSDDEDDTDEQGTKILDNLLDSFAKTSGSSGDGVTLGKTHEYLINFFQSGSNVCLICFDNMKKTDAVWSCECCFCIFHLGCIQTWVKDGVYQKTALSPENFPNRDIPWYCPKCRYEYSQSRCPSRYTCYCGKVRDPVFDPWLVPHSCGETCDRLLRPHCGHRCLLPCHPGPCPPCPKTVLTACHCGKRQPEPRRCGNKLWSCGAACGRQLACGHHRCQDLCHPGECEPCPRSGPQRCVCGREETDRPCASPQWNCQRPCGKPLLCGHHRCDVVCHTGLCGMCPRSQKRSCPCGKTEHQLDCTEDVPTCGDTCGKLLNCGLHRCTQRCHYGACGTCREMTEKRCRCGSRVKSLQCYKDYVCETRCTSLKSCGKHQCKKKCCDGNCSPCDLSCGKSLSCKNHKCSSPCHTGSCYPCPLMVSVSCRCGETSFLVPCGREKVTKPPRCKNLCLIAPDCHHESRDKHRCHFGACPPCRLVCGRALPGCDHACTTPCHTAVRRLVQEKVKRAGPWEPAPAVREEVARLPCPPCPVPTPQQCLGNHETSQVPCSGRGVYSCGRVCGRVLACGNHTCQLECHQVLGAPGATQAGTNCAPCEEPCTAPRPVGCPHRCVRPCHRAPCAPCRQMVKMRCHCQVMVKHVECHLWCDPNRDRDELKSCDGTCPKKLSCGHLCTTSCHPPPCPSAATCRENVTLKCPCKRRKKTALCPDVTSGKMTLECDDVCDRMKKDKIKALEKEEELRRAEELERNKKELEEFERKTKGRGRHRKRRQAEEMETTFLQKHGRLLFLSSLVLLLSLFVWFLLQS